MQIVSLDLHEMSEQDDISCKSKRRRQFACGIVRMCVKIAPFFSTARYMIGPPFLNKKYMNGPIFLDSYVKVPIFLTSSYMHMFFAQRFFEAVYLLGIT